MFRAGQPGPAATLPRGLSQQCVVGWFCIAVLAAPGPPADPRLRRLPHAVAHSQPAASGHHDCPAGQGAARAGGRRRGAARCARHRRMAGNAWPACSSAASEHPCKCFLTCCQHATHCGASPFVLQASLSSARRRCGSSSAPARSSWPSWRATCGGTDGRRSAEQALGRPLHPLCALGGQRCLPTPACLRRNSRPSQLLCCL